MRKVFYDTEFLENGSTIELISIGMVDENGREYYAVNLDFPLYRYMSEPWLRENVLPSLPVRLLPPQDGGGLGYYLWDWRHPHWTALKTRRQIAEEVKRFLVGGVDGVVVDRDTPELWAYYGAYDHVALAQLFGRMIDLPAGIPMFTHELCQAWEVAGRPDKPAQKEGKHNALGDAQWNRRLYKECAAALARKQWPAVRTGAL